MARISGLNYLWQPNVSRPMFPVKNPIRERERESEREGRERKSRRVTSSDQ